MKIAGSFESLAGQFYMVRDDDSFMTLSRPLSVYDVDDEGITFMYKVLGKGTRHLAKLRDGDTVTIFGPYGNSFPVEEYKDKSVLLVGGGVGIAPLFLTAKHLNNVDICLGVNTVSMTEAQGAEFQKLFAPLGETVMHYDCDMTGGIDYAKYDAIMTCGPEIMMKKLTQHHDNVFVSTEKRMGCGLGACMTCTCSVKGENKKTCLDGPIFRGGDYDFSI